MTDEERLNEARERVRTCDFFGGPSPVDEAQEDAAFLLRLLDEAREQLSLVTSDRSFVIHERDGMEKRLAELAILVPCPSSGESVCDFRDPCDVCRLLGRRE